MKDYVTIKLDRKRRLKFTSGPVDAIYRRLGFGWPKLSKKEAEKVVRKWQELDLGYLSLFLWAGLVWEDSELTVNEVKNILERLRDDPGRLSLMAIALVQATSLFYVKISKARKENEKLTANIGSIKEKYSDLLKRD